MAQNDKLLLVALFYVILCFPTGWFIGQIIKTYLPRQATGLSRAGLLIGVAERIIVFTFVLRNQYEAIGLLIAAKSILRFREQDAELQTEYVLVGTLFSLFAALIAGETFKTFFL